ncbi:TetR/AcrR family transcriptional regulator [Homoserinibacter gongjuensis]|uniref:HTH tetR-type domain-containing protein n=1 Tax=Homoserinibacter gongjuensis TaxID=1162968 RepID=A0ABQ6JTT6_9MICO|nr:TetR/AcrR family transcriptional regulator [Homoserinibacter gongjuensis]GMA90499.1 hypothetical protein GCM10025869_10280 [Homoserinibacter gongjuensis]
MPRISAPTVAEHRAAQRAALLRAGEAVLLEASVAGVTPRSVCERAGLARSSFYDYFASKDDLLVAIAIDAIERWDAELEVALGATEPGAARLRAYVEHTMAMTAEGRHAIAGALRDAPLSPSHRDDLMTLHDAMLRPLRPCSTSRGSTPAPPRRSCTACSARAWSSSTRVSTRPRSRGRSCGC